MMTIEQIKEALKDRKLTVVAEKTGLSYDTVRRVAAGDSDYHVSTIKKLSDYLQGK